MREKKEINIQIGEQVKKAREQASLTQEQLAEQIEVSPQYVSDLARGVVGISKMCIRDSPLCLGRAARTGHVSEAGWDSCGQKHLRVFPEVCGISAHHVPVFHRRHDPPRRLL